MKNKFEYTTDGFVEAIKYLKSIGRHNEAERGFSADGYSIVHLANDIYYQSNKCDDCSIKDKCDCKK